MNLRTKNRINNPRCLQVSFILLGVKLFFLKVKLRVAFLPALARILIALLLLLLLLRGVIKLCLCNADAGDPSLIYFNLFAIPYAYIGTSLLFSE